MNRCSGLRAGAALALALLTPGIAAGHVVFERDSLRQFLAESSQTVVAVFESGPEMWAAEDGSDRHEFYRVHVEEVLVGTPLQGSLDYFPHAEGLPRYRVGDRALLFLEPASSRDEFASLARRFDWFSVQRPGQEWRIEAAHGEAVIGLARAQRDLIAAGGGTAQERRDLLLRGLRSDVALLQQDAIVELIASRGDAGLLGTPAGTAPFAALTRPGALPLTTSVALIRLLAGAPGFDDGAALLALEAPELGDRDRLLLIQAASASPDARLTQWLVAQLQAPSRTSQLAAARALRRSWHRTASAALAGRIDPADPELARAALQSLASVGGPEARAALEAASELPDRKLRSVAEAGLRRMAAAEARAGKP